MSILLGLFPHQSGAKLGITGIKAFTFKKAISTSPYQIFGVVQLGVDASSSSDPDLYTPDGKELALFYLYNNGDI